MVSKLVFYAQSTGVVVSGRYTSDTIYLIFNNVSVLKWVLKPCLKGYTDGTSVSGAVSDAGQRLDAVWLN